MSRKILPYILCVALFLAAGLLIAWWAIVNKQSDKKSTTIVCTRLPEVKITGRRPALTLNYRLQWDNHTKIKVYFFSGDTPFTRSIIQIANEWSTNSGISFQLVKDQPGSDVRVNFKRGGYGSAIGIECKEKVYFGKPTMYLEGIDTLKDKAELKRIVLHEFGHALGLEHELSNPNARIPWDTIAVYAYYKEKYSWDETRVKKEVLYQLEPGNKAYEEFDATSIMVYAIGPPLVPKESAIPWPKGLSANDKKFIAIWYPKK